MAMPERDREVVGQWVAARNAKLAEHARDQIRSEFDESDRALTIIEARPPWRDDFGPEWSRSEAARLRYTTKTAQWTLYWSDSNGKFHLYDTLRPTSHVRRLLAEIDRDPMPSSGDESRSGAALRHECRGRRG